MFIDFSSARPLLTMLVLAAALLACKKEEVRQQAADTPATAVVESVNPTPPPVSEPSRIGQMPLLDRVRDEALCSTRGEAATRIVLQEQAPSREVTVGLGNAGRTFLPTFVEVRGKQIRSDAQEENETVYVGFTETGGIDAGRRQYYLTGSAPRDVSSLLPDDLERAKELALQVVQRCRSGSR